MGEDWKFWKPGKVMLNVAETINTVRSSKKMAILPHPMPEKNTRIHVLIKQNKTGIHNYEDIHNDQLYMRRVFGRNN